MINLSAVGDSGSGARGRCVGGSQDDTKVFDLVLQESESRWKGRLGDGDTPQRRQKVRKLVLEEKDRYGNTALHLAAWNGKTAMLDRLVKLGAKMDAMNKDGLTAFTLAARYGVWKTFNHIWTQHLTRNDWSFGNVRREAVDYSSFDWKGLVGFGSRAEADTCRDALMELYFDSKQYEKMHEQLSSWANKNGTSSELDADMQDLKRKVCAVNDLRDQRNKERDKVKTGRRGSYENVEKGLANLKNTDDNQFEDAVSVVRLITLFQPTGWYKEAGPQVKEVVMRKWAAGFNLVHLGQSVVPYLAVLALFCAMWYLREIDVLQHNFWWAEPRAVNRLAVLAPGFPVLQNPVSADRDELRKIVAGEVVSRPISATGLLPSILGGPESTCGWEAVTGSYSGAVQVALILYGVPSLLQLAYAQRRIRPSDLDTDQNSRISFEEIINFMYFNLEPLINVVLSVLLIVIGASRVVAGPECDIDYLRAEKNATAVASIFFFFNLFIICKPYKGIGVLVLTVYRFLVSEIFNFLIMYSIFFTAFLLCLQTLHSANHVFLAWMDSSPAVVNQILILTNGTAYLLGNNLPPSANQLVGTHMAMYGCHDMRRTIYDTAFTLLEISFGDGLSDALMEARRQDYSCPGFSPDNLVGYVLVVWVFLTNILVWKRGSRMMVKLVQGCAGKFCWAQRSYQMLCSDLVEILSSNITD